jgi:hypothetical protein
VSHRPGDCRITCFVYDCERLQVNYPHVIAAKPALIPYHKPFSAALNSQSRAFAGSEDALPRYDTALLIFGALQRRKQVNPLLLLTQTLSQRPSGSSSTANTLINLLSVPVVGCHSSIAPAIWNIKSNSSPLPLQSKSRAHIHLLNQVQLSRGDQRTPTSSRIHRTCAQSIVSITTHISTTVLISLQISRHHASSIRGARRWRCQEQETVHGRS